MLLRHHRLQRHSSIIVVLFSLDRFACDISPFARKPMLSFVHIRTSTSNFDKGRKHNDSERSRKDWRERISCDG